MFFASCVFFRHAIAADGNGRAYSWGNPTFGRLGHDMAIATGDVRKPKLILTLASVSSCFSMMHVHDSVSCAVPVAKYCGGTTGYLSFHPVAQCVVHALRSQQLN